MLRLLMTLIVACLAPALAEAQQFETEIYTLQPGDRIAITVLEDPSLSRNVLIGPDGRISLPLAGSVFAAGLTADAVAARISSALAADFISPPTVDVALVGTNAPIPQAPEALTGQIYALGAIGSPGAYTIDLPMDILQFLAVVGGPNSFAATDRIQVRRRATGSESVLLFNYETLVDGAVPRNAIQLEDGDVVIVPERGLFD